MKAIKCINNNVAICLDSSGNEVVVFGKGVGFQKPPFEVDLSKIDRTYYDIEPNVISMIGGISEEVLKLSSEIIDYARNSLDSITNSSVVFTLADHISFAIKRYQKNMQITLPIINDIEELYEKEYKVGVYALKLIREKLHVYLPREEAGYIALHIINVEDQPGGNDEKQDDVILSSVIKIIEDTFEINIEKQGVNYSRFVSHLHYLLKRGKTKHLIKTNNSKLYESVTNEFPKTNECAHFVAQFIDSQLNVKLTDEEILYLILHINRLCTREDCNQ